MKTNPVPQKVSLPPVELLSEGYRLVKDQYWLLVGICTVGLLVSSFVPFGILLGPMMCGIYLCMFRRMRGETVTFDLLFKGFDYFVEALVATLIIVGISLVVLVPLYVVMIVGMMMIAVSAEGGSGGGIGVILIFAGIYLLMFLIGFLVGALFVFVYPLIVDRGLKGFDAVKISVAAFRANPGGLLLLILVAGFVGLVAALMCYVPAFLVAPITLGAIAQAYRRVFPAPTDSEAPDAPS